MLVLPLYSAMEGLTQSYKCDNCSATWSSCAQNTQMMIPPLWFTAVGWSWQMLDWFFWLYSVPQCHKQRCAFFPFPRVLCSCYNHHLLVSNEGAPSPPYYLQFTWMTSTLTARLRGCRAQSQAFPILQWPTCCLLVIFPSHLLITTSYRICLTNWEFTPKEVLQVDSRHPKVWGDVLQLQAWKLFASHFLWWHTAPLHRHLQISRYGVWQADQSEYCSWRSIATIHGWYFQNQAIRQDPWPC